MDNKTPYTDLYTEAKTTVKLATKYHESVGNECNYIREQIKELQSRLAEKESVASDALYEVKQALKTVERIENGN